MIRVFDPSWGRTKSNGNAFLKTFDVVGINMMNDAFKSTDSERSFFGIEREKSIFVIALKAN